MRREAAACLYFPFICTDADHIERLVEKAAKLGIRGVLIHPSSQGWMFFGIRSKHTK